MGHPRTSEADHIGELASLEARLENGEFSVEARDLFGGLEKIYMGQEDIPFSTGWAELDNFYRVQLGEWCVLSGIASHGKSAFLDNLVMSLAKNEKMKFSVFSPENRPYQRHLRKLVEIHADCELRRDTGFGVTLMPMGKLEAAMKFVHEYFRWIDLGDSPTLTKIVAAHDYNITNWGAQGIIIDPWNEIAHNYGGSSETEYISNCLSILREWTRMRKVALWIVAHPAKIQRNKDGTYPIPGLWDISGSSKWRDKADVGIICHRSSLEENHLDVYVQKVRFKTSGKPGSVRFSYNPYSNRMKPM